MGAGSLPLDRQVLEQLRRLWHDERRRLATRLAPGLTADETGGRLAAIGVAAPAELLVWWGWHNGTQNEAHATMTDTGFAFLGIDWAVQAAVRHRGYAPDRVLLDQPWDPTVAAARQAEWGQTLVPISRSPAGFLVVDCYRADAMSPVWFFDREGGDHDALPLFRSMREMVEHMISRTSDALSKDAFQQADGGVASNPTDIV